MTIDREGVHQSHALLVDPQTIRKRVLAGDGAFAQRVLLAALIKGSNEERDHILAEVGYEHFFSIPFQLLFVWVSQALSSTGQVDESALYEQMKAYVRDHWTSESDPSFDGAQHSAEQVMTGYLTPIDHVLAIDMPDAETTDHAIASLQKYFRRRSARGGQRDSSRTDETCERLKLGMKDPKENDRSE